MKTVNTVVGIVHDGEFFLILKKKGTWIGWQFVQGAKEKNESEELAVLREVKEETGLDTRIEKKLEYKRDYWFTEDSEKIHKELVFFLVIAKKTKDIQLCIEHSDFGWFKEDEVLERIKYNKDVFEDFIKQYK